MFSVVTCCRQMLEILITFHKIVVPFTVLAFCDGLAFFYFLYVIFVVIGFDALCMCVSLFFYVFVYLFLRERERERTYSDS